MVEARAGRVRVERLVAGGAALGHDSDGRVVLVEGALPGELVEVEATREKKDYVIGRAIDVIEPSSTRVQPACPHRLEGCGGCGWMHLAVATQLEAKVAIVRESLQRIGRFEPTRIERLVETGGSVEPVGYRTSIRVVGGADARPAFRRARSDRAVAIEGCLVADPRLREAIEVLEIEPGAEVDARTSVATGALTLRARGGGRPILRCPPGAHLGPRAYLDERVAGRPLRVSAASFFQSGAQAAELLVHTVHDVAPEIDRATHLVDAYGGVGLFAATSGVDRVTVVESSRSACADARHNLAAREATVVRSEVARWRPRAGGVELVVADPARSGLGRPGVASLTHLGAPVLVLVSCDPVSMARDAALLSDAGYRPERVVVVDLMPQTSHVETVARFERTVRS